MSLEKLMADEEAPHPVQYHELEPTVLLREIFNDGMLIIFRECVMTDIANEHVLTVITALENRITILEDALRESQR